MEGGVFEEGLLEGVEAAGGGHALDGLDLAALGFDAEDQAGIDDAAVEHDGAGAAVAVVAALFGAGHTEDVAQNFQQALARFAEEIGILAVDFSLNVNDSGHPLASLGARYGDVEGAARQYAD